ncbi:sirohydrochlorin cobaltochelatase [Ilyobacter polytropus]|uniref:Sirohydrochlorin cobaltochelatase n=1 Tax=Ilyobacter polytropus (strain ATCC 51220 / DSM 2926 / LMG 16218 / CuHBu1) TaxID=572544 RepID=E3HCB8_ILYPC|nr:sirohydrochlorin cobaltochelatase [Ilyobacter polytropus]ADO84378.1 Sirohydrochlorin cobaltochelatase [Ilyobacter polytropus DSM 2926]
MANKNYSDNNLNICENVKKGILMVHFGTVKAEVRKNTLGLLNKNIAEKFQEFQIREAYTSRMIIKRIYTKYEVRKSTPKEALRMMAQDGFTHVIVQASHVINGLEGEYLKDEIKYFKDEFQEIRMGDPLLTLPEDYIQIADIFKKKFENTGGAVVLAGHGTRHHSNSAYGMLQTVFNIREMEEFYISTVEGYPALDDLITQLKKDRVKKVTLVPFMIVAGNHVKEDIDGEWRETLEKEGFSVEVIMRGMGEMPEIHEIFAGHIKRSINSKEKDLKNKKDTILKSI